MAKKKAAMTEREQDEAELEEMTISANEVGEISADELIDESAPEPEVVDRKPAKRMKDKPRDPGIINKEDCTPEEIKAAFAASLSGVVSEAFNGPNSENYARANATFAEQRLAWRAQLPEIEAQFERAYRRGRV